ncbi:hypothetical protein R1sor_025662 [Riccia sorocarpa]|uniref:Uncharacterized protein n=1 Tax=Riccia sorocarpa TaxID=122646 RepID=A0ABD3GD59_9MARC
MRVVQSNELVDRPWPAFVLWVWLIHVGSVILLVLLGGDENRHRTSPRFPTAPSSSFFSPVLNPMLRLLQTIDLTCVNEFPPLSGGKSPASRALGHVIFPRPARGRGPGNVGSQVGRKDSFEFSEGGDGVRIEIWVAVSDKPGKLRVGAVHILQFSDITNFGLSHNGCYELAISLSKAGRELCNFRDETW